MKALLVSLALLLIPSLAQAQYGQPRKPVPVARGFGFSASPYGYRWSQTAVPLPTYSGYGNYVVPQTQYYFNPGYGAGGYGMPSYYYQTPSIFQGAGGYYVPYGD